MVWRMPIPTHPVPMIRLKMMNIAEKWPIWRRSGISSSSRKSIFFFPYIPATLPHIWKRQPYEFIDWTESVRSLKRMKMSSLTELMGYTDITHWICAGSSFISFCRHHGSRESSPPEKESQPPVRENHGVKTLLTLAIIDKVKVSTTMHEDDSSEVAGDFDGGVNLIIICELKSIGCCRDCLCLLSFLIR